MKITRRQLKRLISEAVKQYAGSPEADSYPAVGSERYENLKNMAAYSPGWAMASGYTPEIKGDELELSTDPTIQWFMRTYDEYEDPSKEETTHLDKLRHVMNSYQRIMTDTLDPRRRARFSGPASQAEQTKDPELRYFWMWRTFLFNPISKLAKDSSYDDSFEADFYPKFDQIISRAKRFVRTTYKKNVDALTAELNANKNK